MFKLYMLQPKPKKSVFFVPFNKFLSYFFKSLVEIERKSSFLSSLYINVNTSGQNHSIRYVFGLGYTLGPCLLTILFPFIFGQFLHGTNPTQVYVI